MSVHVPEEIVTHSARDGFWTFLVVLLIIMFGVAVAILINTDHQFQLFKEDLQVGTVIRPYSVGSLTSVDVDHVMAISSSFAGTDSTVAMEETQLIVTTSVGGASSTLTTGSSVQAAGVRTPLLVTNDLQPEFLTISDSSFVSSSASVTNYWFPPQQDLSPGLCLGSVPGSNQLRFLNTQLSEVSYGIVSGARWNRVNAVQPDSGSLVNPFPLFFSDTTPAVSSGQTNSPNIALFNPASGGGGGIGLTVPVGLNMMFYWDMTVLHPPGGPVGPTCQAGLVGGGMGITSFAQFDNPLENYAVTLQLALTNPYNTVTFLSNSFMWTIADPSPVTLQIINGKDYTIVDYNIVALSV